MGKVVSILIADDEPLIRKYIVEPLRMNGHVCREVRNEWEALHLFEEGFVPESALVDALIPGDKISMDIDSQSYGYTRGLRLCRYIKTDINARCRIILNTGMGDYIRFAQRLGIWGYNVKPTRDINFLCEQLCKGTLSDEEIGKPVIDIAREIDILHGRRERE